MPEKKEPSWDQIGKSIGKKIEKEFKNPKWKGWKFCHEEKNGFFGRILFIIGVLIALNIMGVLEAVPGWVQVLIGVGFALMRF